MANSWGQAADNNIYWGQGAFNSTNSWGKIYEYSHSGDTN